ncbi:hypothetical protein RRSWK_06317 [Rhodopirellula sp. SWK7]|nr:hypothetical protein RRSWK_06317 [Rhodopirellula sp. SWK7]
MPTTAPENHQPRKRSSPHSITPKSKTANPLAIHAEPMRNAIENNLQAPLKTNPCVIDRQ